MRRIALPTFLLALALVLAFPALADEGMWTPEQLPQLAGRLTEMGLEMSPAKLADLKGYPMNAVISLGGCTASFVSPEGLAVTNHHCAYRAIQYNSTEDNNLMENGFLAENREGELFAGPGSRILVTVDVRDVTDRVTRGLSDAMGGLERHDAIESARKALVAECERDEGYRCSVRSFYGGVEYHLIKALEIRDVRLVYAPADGIGNFGGDIDNWQWPRHTGDYSFYRAYVGPDGKPADYSEKNVPFRPEHRLRVSTDGVRDGDFVMVAGYPGVTGRYRLADEVESRFDWYYPTRLKLYEEALRIIDDKTEGRSEAAIKYAGWVQGLNNSLKNYQGMLEGYAHSDMLERKREQEDALRMWASAGDGTRSEYGRALTELRRIVSEEQRTRDRDLMLGMMHRRALVSTAETLYRLSIEREKKDVDRDSGYQQRDWQRIEERLRRMDRSFDPEVDRALLRAAVVNYAAIPVGQHVPSLDAWFGIEGNRVDDARLDATLDRMYGETGLDELDRRIALFEAGRKEIEQSDDPFLKFAVATYPDRKAIEDHEKEVAGELDKWRPRYLKGLIAWKAAQGEPIYPDANGTLRVTVGTVEGYEPKDGVRYLPFTTLEGVVAKDTGQAPFNSPPALLEAVRDKRYGPLVDPDLGSVPVDFLSNVDTTGGNSGSPTLNGRGELVGLLFDGVFESIIADWDFQPDVTRSIHVDIRYVLWVMSRVDGADRLLREMGVELPEPPPLGGR